MEGGLGVPSSSHGVTGSDGSKDGLANLTGGTYRSADGSGILATTSSGSDWVVTNRAGIQFHYPGAGANPYIQDSNGNKITTGPCSSIVFDSSQFGYNICWGMYDTLNRAWYLESNANPATYGCPSGTTTASLWVIPAPTSSGSTRAFTFCYQTISIASSLGGGYTEYRATPYLLNAVVLPNGRSWQFAYNSWGDVTQVTFPTGGTISYTYDIGGRLWRRQLRSRRSLTNGF